VPDAERLQQLQRLLADALTSADPAASVRARAGAGDWPEFAAIDPDGLRMAALLVSKLRFERLVQGSRAAAELFQRDGRGFTAAFAEYHRDVPPRAHDPWEEAAAFRAWLDREKARRSNKDS
jgi:hypothetical protein